MVLQHLYHHYLNWVVQFLSLFLYRHKIVDPDNNDDKGKEKEIEQLNLNNDDKDAVIPLEPEKPKEPALIPSKELALLIKDSRYDKSDAAAVFTDEEFNEFIKDIKKKRHFYILNYQ